MKYCQYQCILARADELPLFGVMSLVGRGTPHLIPMFLPSSAANFFFALFSLFPLPNVPQRPMRPPRNALNFRLRHFHAVTASANVYFADAPFDSFLYTDAEPLSIPIAPIRTARPESAEAFAEARALSMRGQSAVLRWDEEEIPGPDVSKRESLLLLAKMTSNAYVEPNSGEWYNLTDDWGIVCRLILISLFGFRS